MTGTLYPLYEVVNRLRLDKDTRFKYKIIPDNYKEGYHAFVLMKGKGNKEEVVLGRYYSSTPSKALDNAIEDAVKILSKMKF